MHYHHAAATPLVNGPIAAEIGPFDGNEYGDMILHGILDLSDIDEMPEVEDIVSGMRYPDLTQPTPTFDATITNDDFFNVIYKYTGMHIIIPLWLPLWPLLNIVA